MSSPLCRVDRHCLPSASGTVALPWQQAPRSWFMFSTEGSRPHEHQASRGKDSLSLGQTGLSWRYNNTAFCQVVEPARCQTGLGGARSLPSDWVTPHPPLLTRCHCHVMTRCSRSSVIVRETSAILTTLRLSNSASIPAPQKGGGLFCLQHRSLWAGWRRGKCSGRLPVRGN